MKCCAIFALHFSSYKEAYSSNKKTRGSVRKCYQEKFIVLLRAFSENDGNIDKLRGFGKLL